MSNFSITIYNQTGEKVREAPLNSAIFDVTPKNEVVHQVAVAMLANKRQVIADTKTRGEIRGGGRKPWRQKGTGRARHGSIRSPLWRGGGIIFGPTAMRNFSQKINKKMNRKAILMCLTDKFQNNNLLIVEDFDLKQGKTKEFVEIVKNLRNALDLQVKRKKRAELKNEKENKKDKKEDWTEDANKSDENQLKKLDLKDYRMSLLVIVPGTFKKIFQAGRNIPGLKILTANSLNVLDLLKFRKALVYFSCLEIMEKNFLKK